MFIQSFIHSSNIKRECLIPELRQNNKIDVDNELRETFFSHLLEIFLALAQLLL